MRGPAHRRGVHVGLRRRGLRAALTAPATLAALAALVLASCGGSDHSVSRSRAELASQPPEIKQATIPKATALARTPPLSRLQVSLGKLFGKAGQNSGGEVYDLSARASLYALRADVGRPPASVEKLYTTLAALRDLGPSATFKTTLLGVGHLGRRGVWHGDVYLKGGGDPTFGDDTFNHVWNEGFGPTAADLVGQLRAQGVKRITGKVIGDESLFDSARGGPASGYAPDIGDLGGQLSALTYDHGGTEGPLTPPEFAAKELVLTMRAQHIKARPARGTGVAPPDARQLGVVTSPPLSTLLGLMDVRSDDLFAEMLTKQLGVRLGGGAGQISAGAGVIASVLADYGLHPKVVDGSGLSRGNDSSPAQVVSLLRQIWRTPLGNDLSQALPVVGVSGTVERIGVHTPAQGRCIAKTGTLSHVTNLAGYCTNRMHHVLAFALFIDGPDNTHAKALLSRMLGAIAG